jgi:hypothetical protein
MGLATLALKNAAIDSCLRTYQTNGATAQIFSDSLLESPRFGIAPHLWHSNFGSGLTYRPVQKFSVVFIGGVRFNDGSGPGTATVFYPDDADSSTITLKKGNWVVEQVGGYLILDTMVSNDVLTFYPGFNDDSLMPSLTK